MFIKVTSINSGTMLIREESIDSVTLLRLNGRQDGKRVGSIVKFKSGTLLEADETPDELLLLLNS